MVPVVAMPSTKWRCAAKKSSTMGMVVMTEAVTRISQWNSPPKPYWSTSAFRPRGIVNVLLSRR